jgi:hypothetical protein
MIPHKGAEMSGESRDFLVDGVISLRGCLDLSTGSRARRFFERSFGASNLVPDDPSSWPRGHVVLPPRIAVRASTLAPDLVDFCTSILGRPRNVKPWVWTSALILNHGTGRECGDDWHIDGDFFRHYVDGAEQALVVVVLWTDVAPGHGATLVVPGSHIEVVRWLNANPEGAELADIPFGEIADRLPARRELTGRAGDVYVLHPKLIHGTSANPDFTPRVISNAVVSLDEPLRLAGSADEEWPSLLERSYLFALGAEKPNLPAGRVAGQRSPPARLAQWSQGYIASTTQRREPK